MSNLYRASAPRGRQSGSRFFAAVKIIVVLGIAVGVFILAVRWFRSDDAAIEETDIEAVADASAVLIATTTALPEQSSITLVAVEGEAGSATATRSHMYGEYALSIVADLPAVDPATTAYEVWFVTSGITDFFSLGEMYPREDGKWGLVWAQTDALVRNDIAEFNRIIVIREPRDGHAGPSADHVLSGTFE